MFERENEWRFYEVRGRREGWGFGVRWRNKVERDIGIVRSR